jgi:MFS family permease
METLPAPILPDPAPELAALALRYRRANGPVMALVNRIGGGVEHQLDLLPPAARARLEQATAAALTLAWGAATLGDRAPRTGRRGPLVAAIASGAAGGAGGLATALAELPVTVSILLHAIRGTARDEGYDPDAPEIRAECLRIFGAGSPLAEDDGIDTAFFSARLTLTGPAVQRLIASVAPRLAAALGQKLAAQAVPVLGAISGAAVNAGFLSYYTEIARIRFRLMRLAEVHGAERVLEGFREAASPPRLRRA